MKLPFQISHYIFDAGQGAKEYPYSRRVLSLDIEREKLEKKHNCTRNPNSTEEHDSPINFYYKTLIK